MVSRAISAAPARWKNPATDATYSVLGRADGAPLRMGAPNRRLRLTTRTANSASAYQNAPRQAAPTASHKLRCADASSPKPWWYSSNSTSGRPELVAADATLL